AGDAKLQCRRHFIRYERGRTKLSGDRQPQGIRPSARDVALVPGHAVTGAHHPACQFAAGAIVVAHLRGALETTPGARICRPVQPGLERLAVIVGRITEEAAIVEFGWPHDLAGIEEPFGIEPILDLLEGASEPRPEHGFVELRTHKAVAVFAGMRALVFA